VACKSDPRDVATAWTTGASVNSTEFASLVGTTASVAGADSTGADVAGKTTVSAGVVGAQETASKTVIKLTVKKKKRDFINSPIYAVNDTFSIHHLTESHKILTCFDEAHILRYTCFYIPKLL